MHNLKTDIKSSSKIKYELPFHTVHDSIDEFEQTPEDGGGQGSLVCKVMGLQKVRYN